MPRKATTRTSRPPQPLNDPVRQPAPVSTRWKGPTGKQVAVGLVLQLAERALRIPQVQCPQQEAAGIGGEVELGVGHDLARRLVEAQGDQDQAAQHEPRSPDHLLRTAGLQPPHRRRSTRTRFQVTTSRTRAPRVRRTPSAGDSAEQPRPGPPPGTRVPTASPGHCDREQRLTEPVLRRMAEAALVPAGGAVSAEAVPRRRLVAALRSPPAGVRQEDRATGPGDADQLVSHQPWVGHVLEHVGREADVDRGVRDRQTPCRCRAPCPVWDSPRPLSSPRSESTAQYVAPAGRNASAKYPGPPPTSSIVRRARSAYWPHLADRVCSSVS